MESFSTFLDKFLVKYLAVNKRDSCESEVVLKALDRYGRLHELVTRGEEGYGDAGERHL